MAMKPQSKSIEPQAPTEAPVSDTDEITYVPADGDPVRTTWNGISFSAMVPVKVSRKHTVLVPIRQTRELPDGNMVSQAVEKRIPMVDLARGNSRFMVNGVAPSEVKRGQMRLPADPDQYRGYAINWIASSTASSAMDTRWDAEQALRDRCGVNDSDVAYLRPFFEARHKECTVAESEGGVAKRAA